MANVITKKGNGYFIHNPLTKKVMSHHKTLADAKMHLKAMDEKEMPVREELDKSVKMHMNGTFKPAPAKDPIKKTGTFHGKSNKIGHGGRAAQLHGQLKAKGLPESEIGAIIGKNARRAQAAPGQKNYHGN